MPRSVLARSGRLAACGVLATAAIGGVFAGTSQAGGHVDSPSVMADPPSNITDVYAFSSPDNPAMATLIMDSFPFEVPGNPAMNYPFAPGARYEIHIDGRGTGVPDTTYRWTFRNEDRRMFGVGPIAAGPVRSLNDPNLVFRQHYTLERIQAGQAPQTLVADGIAAPTSAGTTLMPDYGALRSQATVALPGGGRTVAGQEAESFVADARVFGLFVLGTAGPVPGALPASNPLAVLNVNSLVLQVPKTELALNGNVDRNPVVGVWATMSRPSVDLSKDLKTQTPDFRQVSRLGMPHINFALYGSFGMTALPGGPEDRSNSRTADQDHLDQAFLASSLDPAPPRRIQTVNGFPAPKTPRTDIRALFLSGIGKDNGSPFGIDLNTQAMNADADPKNIVYAEELRLNLTTPISAHPRPGGVLDGDLQGYPNGRRPNDVIDPPLLRMLEGEPKGPSAAGLLPPPITDLQPAPAGNTFPYLNLPHAGL